MKPTRLHWIVGALLAAAAAAASAGPLDPNCTPEKAAKSAGAKATVGVGGRCDPKEAVTDSAKSVANIDDKGPIEQRHDDKDKAKDKEKSKDKDKSDKDKHKK
jgi:hypothetical protein